MTAEESNQSQQENPDPFIEVVLSRSSYRIGESVVGTIRLVPSSRQQQQQQQPQDVFSDSYVFVAGWCRLDPRWHRRASEYLKKYESPAVHDALHNRHGNGGGVAIDKQCVCFWTTNVLQLQSLQERTTGRWENVKPKPIRGMTKIGNEEAEADDHSNAMNGTETNHKTEENFIPLEEQQLAFSFRVDLPLNLPHSVRANSCRYFYAVMVGTRVRLSRNYQWLRHAVPIQVLSQRPDHPLLAAPPKASGKSPPTVYPMGVCAAMAHSAGLPCHVTATQLYQPPGQILVNRRGTSTLGSLVKSSTSPVQQQALQTMRITDLTGIPCCVLTVMGVSTASPGSRMVLKFDFPTPRMQQQSSSKWTPCYQVSASLEGEELALYASLDGTQKRAQAYQFDTAHELVDPECTERVCLSLQVPLDAPTTVSTDMVRISVKCIIDITVASGNNNNTKKKNNAPTYSNLRLELPVRMVAPMTEYEIILSGEDEEQDEDDAYLKLPLDELILGRSYRTGAVDFDLDDDSPPLIATDALRQTSSPSHPSSFATKGIQQDLTILSLRMAEDCQLIARE